MNAIPLTFHGEAFSQAGLLKQNLKTSVKTLYFGIAVITLLFSVSGCKKNDGGSDSNFNITKEGSYQQSGATIVMNYQNFRASSQDNSAVRVSDNGIFYLSYSNINSSANTSSVDSSSMYGRDAAVLAESGSTINLSYNIIKTTGTGANGIFAYGDAVINTNADTVTCTGEYAHAMMVSGGGKINANDVVLISNGDNAGAIAAGQGGGTILVSGVTASTTGNDSPGVYSSGNISMQNATVFAANSEAAVVEGSGSIYLTSSDLSAVSNDKWGVLLFQSGSEKVSGSQGTFSMSKGSLNFTSSNSPLFYITNTSGIINLSHVAVTNTSGILVKAASGTWGTPGSNGGDANFSASGDSLVGNFIADPYSTLTIEIKSASSLTGSINSANTAASVSLVMDINCTWTLTANSYLNTFNDPLAISGTDVSNITGNGFNIYYDAGDEANSSLGGNTYNLVNGGVLTPQ